MQYPKYEKYALGTETKNSFNRFYRLLITAAKRYYKKTTLHDADVELMILKHFLRMGFERRYTTIKRYERMSRYIEEIGRMLGGWIKATEQQNTKK